MPDSPTPSPTNPTPPEAPADWKTLITDPALREDGTIKDVKSVDDAVKQLAHWRRVASGQNRVPGDDAPPDEWEKFYSRLGRPDKPELYGLEEVAKSLGVDVVSSEELSGLQQLFHSKGVPAKTAVAITEHLMGLTKKAQEEQSKSLAEMKSKWKAQLNGEYGQAYEQKMAVARNFAQAMGGEEFVQLLDAMGLNEHPTVVKALLKSASAQGEARFVSGRAPNATGALSPEEARAEIERLRGDPKFVQERIAGTPQQQKLAAERLSRLMDMALGDKNRTLVEL